MVGCWIRHPPSQLFTPFNWQPDPTQIIFRFEEGLNPCLGLWLSTVNDAPDHSMGLPSGRRAKWANLPCAF